MINLQENLANLAQNNKSFKDFLDKCFQLCNLKLARNTLSDLDIPSFDLQNAIIYFTNAEWEAHLEAAYETGHTNLAFSLIPCATHKRADLIKATKAINTRIPSYNIIFFVGQDSCESHKDSRESDLRKSHKKLSIAFATRRFAKNRTIDTNIIEKITLIKDIDIFRPSHAHLLNLHAIAKIPPSAVNAYYQAILEALSVSALNKRFYMDIFRHFIDFIEALCLPDSAQNDDNKKRDFILRLFCRILFCKFLEKRAS